MSGSELLPGEEPHQAGFMLRSVIPGGAALHTYHASQRCLATSFGRRKYLVLPHQKTAFH